MTSKGYTFNKRFLLTLIICLFLRNEQAGNKIRRRKQLE